MLRFWGKSSRGREQDSGDRRLYLFLTLFRFPDRNISGQNPNPLAIRRFVFMLMIAAIIRLTSPEIARSEAPRGAFRRLPRMPADQARTDFAAIESALEVIQKQRARLPTRRERIRTALGIILAR
jgi:hypothetical protein